jgi:hypothetical protein
MWKRVRTTGALGWIMLVVSAFVAGCNGGGHATIPHAMLEHSAIVPLANPTIAAPQTICQKTVPFVSPSPDGTGGVRPAWGCFMQGGSVSGPMDVAWQTNPANFTCHAGTYSLVHVTQGAVDPVPSLPPPTVTFLPGSSVDGQCHKIDSTTITLSVPSPLPTGEWEARYQVTESYQMCQPSAPCQNLTQNLGDIWLHYGLSITDLDNNSQQIENTHWTRIIGQRANLAARSPWNSVSLGPCTWGVPYTDYAVISYGPYSGAPPPSIVASPSPFPSSTPVGTAMVPYYWFRSFGNFQLNVTCSASNTTNTFDGGNLATQLSAIVTVNAVSPTAVVTTTFANVQVGPFADPTAPPQISLGTEINPPATVGLQAAYSVTAPASYGGYFGPNQLVKFAGTINPTPTSTPENSGGAYILDGCPIYTTQVNGSNILPGPVPTVSPGGTATLTTVDAPTSGTLSNTATSQREQDWFITTLMFKPTIGPNGAISNAIWVPIAEYVWSYDGTATNLGATPTLAPSPPPSQNPLPGSYVSNASPRPSFFSASSSFPSWSKVYPAPVGCPSQP